MGECTIQLKLFDEYYTGIRITICKCVVPKCCLSFPRKQKEVISYPGLIIMKQKQDTKEE